MLNVSNRKWNDTKKWIHISRMEYGFSINCIFRQFLYQRKIKICSYIWYGTRVSWERTKSHSIGQPCEFNAFCVYFWKQIYFCSIEQLKITNIITEKVFYYMPCHCRTMKNKLRFHKQQRCHLTHILKANTINSLIILSSMYLTQHQQQK